MDNVRALLRELGFEGVPVGGFAYVAIERALAQARAEGRREGLEEAAKVAIEEMQRWNGRNNPPAAVVARQSTAWTIAQAIRALALSPPASESGGSK